MSNKVIKTADELIKHLRENHIQVTEQYFGKFRNFVFVSPDLSFAFDTEDQLSSIHTGNGMISTARLVQEDDDLPNYFKSYDRQGNFTGSITFTELPE